MTTEGLERAWRVLRESVKMIDFLMMEDLMCSRVSRIARASTVKMEA